MKPTKCKVFCLDCNRTKMLFETEKKAQTFIKFNGDEIKLETGYCPTRTYYCISCCGYHVTSKPQNENIKSKTELVLKRYEVVKEKDRLNKEKMEQQKIESKKRKKEKNERIVREYNEKIKIKVLSLCSK